MGINKIVLLTIVSVTVLGFQLQALADWEADSADRRQVSTATAVERIKVKVPVTSRYFEDAYGFAVWPMITRVGFGFGGAYGRGMVIEQDDAVGNTSYWQFTSGIQAGAKAFSMIVFFKDKQALDYFKQGKVQFMGQAGIDLATVGAHGTPAYNEGVAVFALTKFGLMGEFTVSGVRFRYMPLQPAPE